MNDDDLNDDDLDNEVDDDWAPAGYVVVANAAAGSARGEAIRAAAGALAERYFVRLWWIDDDGDLDEALDLAARESALPVVAGGDGTVHVVVNRLAGRGETDRPVGVIPAGTGNDLARTLGLPLDPAQAVTRLHDAGPRPMTALDIAPGRGPSCLCINNVHLGVGVAAAQRADGMKRRLGRFAYPAAALASGWQASGTPVRIEADGEQIHEGPALAVVVAVGAHGGGGHALAPGETPETAGATVLVAPDRPRRERLGLAVRTLRTSLEDVPGVITTRARHVTVTDLTPARTGGTPPDGGLTSVIDGEFVELGRHVELRASSAAWHLWMAEDATAHGNDGGK